jgi:hypothetical protein
MKWRSSLSPRHWLHPSRPVVLPGREALYMRDVSFSTLLLVSIALVDGNPSFYFGVKCQYPYLTASLSCISHVMSRKKCLGGHITVRCIF